MPARWQDVATLRVDLGLGASRTPGQAYLWHVARWGQGKWRGLEPYWVAVPCDQVVGLSIRRGRDRSWNPYDVGTLTLALNNESGDYTYNPEADPDTLAMRPGIQVRVGMVIDGVTYWLWRGYIEALDEAYVGLEVTTVTITAQDAMAQLNRTQVPEQVPEGADELSGERVVRILDRGDWPLEYRLVDEGSVRLMPTTYATSLGGELQSVALAEGGTIHASPTNVVTFRQRDWPYAHSTVPKLTIGPGGAVCPVDYQVARDIDDVINEAIYARIGGASQVVIDLNSQRWFGVRTETINNLFSNSDGDVLRMARDVIRRRAVAPPIVRAVTLDLNASSPLQTLCGLDLADLVTLTYEHPREGWSWSKGLHLQSIEHHIDAHGWLMTLGVDDIGEYVPSVDRWGTAVWGSALWSGVA